MVEHAFGPLDAMHVTLYIANMTSTLGSRIRMARKALDLAQDDIAIACGVRRLTVSSWESDSTVPRADQVVALAKRTEVSASWLLTGEGCGPEAREVA